MEKPGGDDGRNHGPFYNNEIHPEKSLWEFFLNANKKGITLNLESKDGIEIFKKLAKKVDFVLVITSYSIHYTKLYDIPPGCT